MVAAFLQAEISSSRYSEYILPNLERNRLSRADLIDSPNLENEFHNRIRRALLQYRGYETKIALFKDFPADVAWRFVEIEPQDHYLFACINDQDDKSEVRWIDLSEGTRSVERIAGSIVRLEQAGSAKERETAERIRGIQRHLNSDKVMPPLIAVEAENGRLILVEGHSRAVAYVDLKWRQNISIVLGRSVAMKSWRYY
jgi:hypothetical protein